MVDADYILASLSFNEDFPSSVEANRILLFLSNLTIEQYQGCETSHIDQEQTRMSLWNKCGSECYGRRVHRVSSLLSEVDAPGQIANPHCFPFQLRDQMTVPRCLVERSIYKLPTPS
jgi:hypothetical protein